MSEYEPPFLDYVSLPLVLLICSVGLFIAGIKLRKLSRTEKPLSRAKDVTSEQLIVSNGARNQNP